VFFYILKTVDDGILISLDQNFHGNFADAAQTSARP